MNHDNLEVKMSFKLNRLNTFAIGGILALSLIALTSFLIAFTPIKEYIPGFSSSKLKKDTRNLVYRIDSLETHIANNEQYIKGIQSLLSGNIQVEDLKTYSETTNIKAEDVNLSASHQDSVFRQEIDEKDRFSVFNNASKTNKIVFFAPVKGEITNNFNSKDKHFAIDIAVAKKTPVKAVADGTVIFSGFTIDTGYVLILEHTQGFLSVYKHNQSLFKEQGELVLSGEVIANSGSTGSLTTGPHLHFELWNEGYPVNPQDYIDFQK